MVVNTAKVIHRMRPKGDQSLSGVYFQKRKTSNMNQKTAATEKTSNRRNT